MNTDHPQGIHVIGDGMVGLLAGVAFLQAGFDVCLSGEQTVLGKEIPPLDDRVSAITPVSVKILQLLGVWEKIPDTQLSPFIQIHIWENSPEKSAKQVPLIFEAIQHTAPLGYIVSNVVLKKALNETLQAIQQKSFSINNNNPDQFGLTIVADGAKSATRQQAGIGCIIKDYHQSAVTAVIHVACLHKKIARQYFLPAGPLAFLPLTNQHHCVVVWSERPEQAKTLATCAPEIFNATLQQAVGSLLGEVSVIGPRSVFSLKRQQAQRYVKPALALVGDAAHTVHPLAGHGVNMGFLDVMVLLKMVKFAISKGLPIGHLGVLRRYERQRKTENLLIASIIHGLTCDKLRKSGIYMTQHSARLRKLFTGFMSFYGLDNLY